MKSWLPMATDGHGHVLCHVPGHQAEKWVYARIKKLSSNCGFWAFYKSGSYQGRSLCSQPTEYEGSFWCSMCQGKWLHLSSAAPVFSLGGGRGSGELTDADGSATGFVHCLACSPPTLTPPYRKSEILARSLLSVPVVRAVVFVCASG